MTEARLKTEIWVQASVRRANIANTMVTVVRRGEASAGAVLVKLNRFAAGCTVLVETREPNGARAWYRGTGEAPVDEASADAYIARSVGRDSDLWVIEVEDRTGVLPFDGRILAT